MYVRYLLPAHRTFHPNADGTDTWYVIRLAGKSDGTRLASCSFPPVCRTVPLARGAMAAFLRADAPVPRAPSPGTCRLMLCLLVPSPPSVVETAEGGGRHACPLRRTPRTPVRHTISCRAPGWRQPCSPASPPMRPYGGHAHGWCTRGPARLSASGRCATRCRTSRRCRPSCTSAWRVSRRPHRTSGRPGSGSWRPFGSRPCRWHRSSRTHSPTGCRRTCH